jgi:hypothetical protein
MKLLLPFFNPGQLLTEEDILQFASNGTSFDGYFKQRIHDLDGKGELILDSALKKMASNQSAITNGVNACMSPLGQMFGAFIRDYTLSLMYEFFLTLISSLSVLLQQ